MASTRTLPSTARRRANTVTSSTDRPSTASSNHVARAPGIEVVEQRAECPDRRALAAGGDDEIAGRRAHRGLEAIGGGRVGRPDPSLDRAREGTAPLEHQDAIGHADPELAGRSGAAADTAGRGDLAVDRR